MIERPKFSGVTFLDGREVYETRQCVHCQKQWEWIPGSGRLRGWCMNCHGITCNTPGCKGGTSACLPFEKKLELYEAGKIKVL